MFIRLNPPSSRLQRGARPCPKSQPPKLICSEVESDARRTLPPITPGPVIEYYKKDIDRTLLRENLKRTVTERFEKLMELHRFAEEMRRAGREYRSRK